MDAGQDRTASKSAEEPPAPADRDWPRPWQSTFLQTLALIPDVSAACRIARVGRSTAYDARGANSDFAAAWDESLEMARDLIQRRAHEWITSGVPVKSVRTRRKTKDGVVVEEETIETVSAERSATLLIFWLKAWYPDRYRWSERIEATGEGGGPLRIESVENLDAQIAELTAEMEARRARGVGQDEPEYEPERSAG